MKLHCLANVRCRDINHFESCHHIDVYFNTECQTWGAKSRRFGNTEENFSSGTDAVRNLISREQLTPVDFHWRWIIVEETSALPCPRGSH